jgi:hypothetical protein
MNPTEVKAVKQTIAGFMMVWAGCWVFIDAFNKDYFSSMVTAVLGAIWTTYYFKLRKQK